jgi:hypothetical protein
LPQKNEGKNSNPSDLGSSDVAAETVSDELNSVPIEQWPVRPDHFEVLDGPDATDIPDLGDEDAILQCEVVNARGVEVNEDTPEEERDRLYVVRRSRQRR